VIFLSDTKGVKKVSERILKENRALILTEENKSKYSWGEIPDGSLHINGQTGLISVKLSGKTDRVPAGIRNDGTICIAKDSRIGIETFLIKTLDDGDGTYTVENENGEQRQDHPRMRGEVYRYRKPDAAALDHPRMRGEVFLGVSKTILAVFGFFLPAFGNSMAASSFCIRLYISYVIDSTKPILGNY
jgi:hypothetical protein